MFSLNFGIQGCRPPRFVAPRALNELEVRCPDPMCQQLLGVRQGIEHLDQLRKQSFRGIGHTSILAWDSPLPIHARKIEVSPESVTIGTGGRANLSELSVTGWVRVGNL